MKFRFPSDILQFRQKNISLFVKKKKADFRPFYIVQIGGRKKTQNVTRWARSVRQKLFKDAYLFGSYKGYT